MSPMRDGTGRDGTGQTTSEDRATQLLIWETLSLAMKVIHEDGKVCPHTGTGVLRKLNLFSTCMGLQTRENIIRTRENITILEAPEAS